MFWPLRWDVIFSYGKNRVVQDAACGVAFGAATPQVAVGRTPQTAVAFKRTSNHRLLTVHAGP